MTNAYYLRQSLDRDQNQARHRPPARRPAQAVRAPRAGTPRSNTATDNVSATTGRRPDYEDLCRDIADGVVKRVAVWDMDRLHRQPARA